MGLRYRRTVKVSRYTKVNLGTQRASMTVGKPGLSVNLSSRGARATVGLPGTGLSYSTRAVGGSRRRKSLGDDLLIVVAIVACIGLLKLIWNLIAAILGAVQPSDSEQHAANDE